MAHRAAGDPMLPDFNPFLPLGEALVLRTYEATAEEIVNPERGFFDWIDLVNDRDFAFVRQRGRSLAYAGVNLKSYRAADIDPAFINKVSAGLDAVRAAGIKVILASITVRTSGIRTRRRIACWGTSLN
ncbi:MAG: DUF4874 domain-containing protein [Planctomycetes bacterium]|nr:DUF4874 domain-containing protein [Planctomycetota bacterium]